MLELQSQMLKNKKVISMDMGFLFFGPPVYFNPVHIRLTNKSVCVGTAYMLESKQLKYPATWPCQGTASQSEARNMSHTRTRRQNFIFLNWSMVLFCFGI